MFQIPSRCRFTALLSIVFAFVLTEHLVGDVVVLQRESFASLTVFAGSGPGVDSYSNSDSLNTLTGDFSFDDEYEAFIDNNTGTAYAFGRLLATDSVLQTSEALDVLIERSASGQRNAISGTALTDSRQRQTIRVRFDITEPVRYTLSGLFDEGLDNGVSRVRLRNVISNRSVFNYNTSSVFNESGLLEPGNNGFRRYELVVDLQDALNPQQSDASAIDLSFRVTAIPEPAGAAALWGATMTTLLTRRRNRIAT